MLPGTQKSSHEQATHAWAGRMHDAQAHRNGNPAGAQMGQGMPQGIPHGMQQPQQHVHSSRCSHGHGHGHSHSHGHGHDPHNQPHEHYFKHLATSWNQNRVFFYRQILTGGAFNTLLEKVNLGILSKLDLSMVKQIIQAFLGFAAGHCLPTILKPFIAGLYIPLLIIMLVNYNFIFTNKLNSQYTTEWYLVVFMYANIVIWFTISALRGAFGTLNNDSIREKSRELIRKKPFVKNPRLYCQQCEIIKGFRSMHCPQCGSCTAKYSKHSMLFNQCIGASNEIPYIATLKSISISLIISIYIINSKYENEVEARGTAMVLTFLDLFVLWQTLIPYISTVIFNIYYNITEFELKTWMMQPYLIAYMKREFSNPLNNGFWTNYKQSCICFFSRGTKYQAKLDVQDDQSSGLSSEETKDPQEKTINWCQEIIITPAQLPSHPNRREIADKMVEMEARMNQQVKMMDEVRKRVNEKYKGKLSPEEIQYHVMMEMQAIQQRQMQQQMEKMMRERGPEMQKNMPPELVMRLQAMERMRKMQEEQKKRKDPEEEQILMSEDRTESEPEVSTLPPVPQPIVPTSEPALSPTQPDTDLLNH